MSDMKRGTVAANGLTFEYRGAGAGPLALVSTASRTLRSFAGISSPSHRQQAPRCP